MLSDTRFFPLYNGDELERTLFYSGRIAKPQMLREKLKIEQIDIDKSEAGENIIFMLLITQYWINSLNIQPASVLSFYI